MQGIRNRLKTSVRPATVHLMVSASIALLAVGLIFLVWYPGALAEAQGVSRLVLIMIAVDVVIGPLITLIIFDRKKKWLMLDLTAIAAMQTIALLYGLQAIHGGRPAYVVFNIDRFDVVPRQDLNADSLARAPDGLGVSQFSPRWVGALLPADPEKRNAIMFSAVQGGADLPQLPEYFVPLDDVRSDMIKRLRPLEELRTLNEMTDPEWEALLVGYGQSQGTMGYLPMAANAKDGAVLVKRDTGEVLDAVMLTPKF